jgi:hypothetical protein
MIEVPFGLIFYHAAKKPIEYKHNVLDLETHVQCSKFKTHSATYRQP